MRGYGALILLAGAAIYYLAVVDRRSPIALDLVEHIDPYGRSLSMGLAFVGVVLLVWPAIRWRKRMGPGVATPPVQRARVSAAYEGADWLDALRRDARGLVLERGAVVEILPDRVPPMRLVMDRLTPEQARRSIDLFVEWLARAPLPGRVAIVYKDMSREGPARQHQLNALMRRSFSGGSYQVVEHEDTLEILFKQPDARWKRG